MEIIHLSAECYPFAKAGGLGDVVGALPKYQALAGHYTKVVLPMYETKFLHQNYFVVDFKGSIYLGSQYLEYTIIKEKTNALGFDLFLIDIKGFLDRPEIYGYDDDLERFFAFQLAFLDWINHWEHQPDVVHCHDHHTALVPFMMQNCYEFRSKLQSVPTVFTIHNGQYQGWMGLDKKYLFPHFDEWKTGLLEWNNLINPMASAIKCAAKVTTVSPSYMEELSWNSKGLEALFEYEKGKCVGILNGIDNDVWNPATDAFISENYKSLSIKKGKVNNKASLSANFKDKDLPLFVFVGRLVPEKAADLLPHFIYECFKNFGATMNFYILGGGYPAIENSLNHITNLYSENCTVYIGYNEALSHQVYAGGDFLLMPSRIEPCGLNQMYALRYGTIPIVHNTGGLKDSIIDIGDEGGFGIKFEHTNVGDMLHAMQRALSLYAEQATTIAVRKKGMKQDNSWQKVIAKYDALYQSLIPH